MNELLLRLLNQLDRIGSDHGELYDSECRDRMSAAIVDGFVRNVSGFVAPEEYGLWTREANLAVREALAQYLTDARQLAAELGIASFHDRLAAFQDADVESSEEGSFYDDFFGYSPPELFDASGKVVS